MLGLDFVLASCARNASGTGACSWGDGDANRANREPPHHSSTETAEPSFGNRRFWFGAVGSFTDDSTPLATRLSGRKTPNALRYERKRNEYRRCCTKRVSPKAQLKRAVRPARINADIRIEANTLSSQQLRSCFRVLLNASRVSAIASPLVLLTTGMSD